MRPSLRGGTGPGPITPDGCAVDHYAQLSPAGEPELVHAAIPAGASILELGAGAGRITHRLLALGHPVVAVDESPDMLAHIHGAQTVCRPIQHLALGRTFDLVLLMSYLIETVSDDLRPAVLATCRAHVAERGCVILQRQRPEWYDTIAPFERVTPDGRIQMTQLDRLEPGLLAITIAYTVGGHRWTHSFVTRRLDDHDLEALLDDAGLTVAGFLDGDRSWVRAVPSQGQPSKLSMRSAK